MSPKKIIMSIVAALVIGALASMCFQKYSLQKEKEEASKGAITENPYYGEFMRVGSRNGLNMEFTRKASCMKSSQLELEKLPLFTYGRKSCDILLVGDSSMAWGIIPEVIEQMTGLKMGVFASEALFLNVPVARMIDNLASYYLKDDGLLVISFGSWTQEQNVNSMVLVYTDWIYTAAFMNHSEFSDYLEKWISDQSPRGSDRNFLNRLKFSRYRKQHADLKNKLAADFGLSLLQIDIYSNYIEPIINPGWYKKKIEMKELIHCYLRWNNRSIIMYSADNKIRSHHSTAPAEPGYANKDIAIVSSILKKIKCRKAYQIHVSFDDKKYARLRGIYASYYRGSFGLIDLGVEHPANESYELDLKEHAINSGSFYQSILMGTYLKKNFPTLGKKQGE